MRRVNTGWTAEEVLARAREVCARRLPTDHPAGVRFFEVDPGGLTIGDLDAVLGERSLLVPMPFADRASAYTVQVEGAPFRCTVHAYTKGAPEWSSRLARLGFRQDP